MPTAEEVPDGTRRDRADAVTVLSFFVLLLFVLPSRLVFKPLGAVGTPAALLTLLGLLWWCFARLLPHLGAAYGSQPMRLGLLLFGASLLASYVAGFMRPLLPIEVSGSDRAMLAAAGFIGSGLLAADGIGSRRRLDVLLRRLVLATTWLAAVGILQFFAGFDIVGLFEHLPGLTANGALGVLEERSVFRRATATTLSAIEFGVVLILVLPLAVHYAHTAEPAKRLARWAGVVVIAFAIPLSLSRSAVIGIATVGLVLIIGWPRERRIRAILVSIAFLGLTRAAVPGLLGTFRSYFVNAGDDPSVQGRTDDLQTIGTFVQDHLIFGRGPGTFAAELYRILDNQYFGTLIENGIVGLVALSLLLLLGYGCARGARRYAADPTDRDLALALAASTASLVPTFATFDALSFPMVTGVTFLLLGCCGALWRLVRHPDQPSSVGSDLDVAVSAPGGD